jgi:hypothetical protein
VVILYGRPNFLPSATTRPSPRSTRNSGVIRFDTLHFDAVKIGGVWLPSFPPQFVPDPIEYRLTQVRLQRTDTARLEVFDSLGVYRGMSRTGPARREQFMAYIGGFT